MNPLENARIGRTGLFVTRLGLGGGPLGKLESPSSATAIVRGAIERGICYFDTAPLYGFGESEKRIGRVISSLSREEFVISTKVGRLLSMRSRKIRFDFSRSGVLRSLEGSLKRLALNHVDMLFIHDPDDYYRWASSEALSVLSDLKSTGTVKAIGVGMNQWKAELRFAKEGNFDCFLLAGRYTLLDQTSLVEFLPYCQGNGISVIAGGPYNSGILASDLQGRVTFDYKVAQPKILARARRIRTICDRHDVPLKAAALQFVLAHPAVASVIPGAGSVSELEENVRMVRLTIPTALWDDLRDEHLIPAEAPVPS